MTAPLDHYRDLIQEHNKTHHKRTLPPHLATIDFLLACHQNNMAAGLAEYLMETETMKQDIRAIVEGWRTHANSDYCRTYNKERGIALNDAADTIDGCFGAAFRESEK